MQRLHNTFIRLLLLVFANKTTLRNASVSFVKGILSMQTLIVPITLAFLAVYLYNLDINRIIPLHVQIRAVPLQERRIQQTLLLFILPQLYCRPAIRLPIALLQPQGVEPKVSASTVLEGC